MDLYINKETNEYVFVDGIRSLIVSEKEFKEIQEFGMSGVLLKLQRDQRSSQSPQ